MSTAAETPAGAETEPRPRKRAARGEGDVLRTELLSAAEELLVEAGDESALTLRAVARRVGVTTPSVYRHFADKATLVEAVAHQGWGELGRRMDAAAAEADDAFEALRRRGVAYVRFGLDHPVHYRLLMMRPPPLGSPDAGVAAASECFEHMVDGVQAVVEVGIFVGDPRTLALGLWAAVHGVVSLLVAKPHFPWPADIDGFVDRAVRMAGMGTAVVSRPELIRWESFVAPPAAGPR